MAAERCSRIGEDKPTVQQARERAKTRLQGKGFQAIRGAKHAASLEAFEC
jgi:hypothetical protein